VPNRYVVVCATCRYQSFHSSRWEANMLSDDLARAIDRLATSIPEGSLESLAGARAALVEDYARWTRALDDLENIWALAAWRSAAEEPLDAVSRLAA
jgi:hypothetical protein